MPGRLKYCPAIGPNLPDSYPAVFKKDIYEDVDEVAKAGCHFAELHVRSPDLLDGKKLARRCADNGIRISGISTGMGFGAEGLSLIDDDAEVRRRARERLEGMIELAATLGSSVIVGLLRGRVPDMSRYSMYEDRLTDNLRLLLEKAEALGVDLQFEAIAHIQCNYFNTAAETAAYVRKFGNKRLGVLLDTYHMNLDERDFAQSVATCGELLSYVHYSDSNRRRPGSGRVDYVAMTRTLRQFGFDGYVGLEYISSAEPLAELKKTLDYLDAIERMLDAEG